VSNLSAADADRLEEACATIAATPARLGTLRVVMDGGDVTAKDVMDALGLTRSAVGYHLAALTEAGMIHERRATHPRGRGPIIYWSADREAIHGLRDTLAEHLT
jgi:DNA-binding transcriptional ArsR family regulator